MQARAPRWVGSWVLGSLTMRITFSLSSVRTKRSHSRTVKVRKSKKTYPFEIDMPMLHCVGNIGSLNQVFNDNGCLPINVIHSTSGFGFGFGFFTTFDLLGCFGCLVCCECHFPTLFAQRTELFVGDIGRHDRIHYKLTKSVKLILCIVNTPPQVFVGWFH